MTQKQQLERMCEIVEKFFVEGSNDPKHNIASTRKVFSETKAMKGLGKCFQLEKAFPRTLDFWDAIADSFGKDRWEELGTNPAIVDIVQLCGIFAMAGFGIGISAALVENSTREEPEAQKKENA